MPPQENQGRWASISFKAKLCIYLFTFIFLSIAIVSVFFLIRRSQDVEQQEDPTQEVDQGSSKKWDLLIFAQSWLNTVCMEWKDKSTKNTCRMPAEKDVWNIHGIWPTKERSYGPTFCNKSYHFNATDLAPIWKNLTEHWIDVKTSDSVDYLWKHEWDKHGTCATSLSSLSTEFKYFATGLKWQQFYNMKGILEKGGVFPDTNTGVNITTIWLAVKTYLGKNPSLHCVYEKETGHYYLEEIKICINKTLKLTDCYSEGLQQQPIGNCPTDKLVFYPSSVPLDFSSSSPSSLPLETTSEPSQSTQKLLQQNDYKLSGGDGLTN